MGELSNANQEKIDLGEIREDRAQRKAISKFDQLTEKLSKSSRRRWGFGRKSETGGGIYLWGGVGRGKSMLMDLWIAGLEIEGKRRVHFHEFMQEVHAGMNKARSEGRDDALAPVADGLVRDLRLLALDEMQINDIADAMIVGRLFDRLLDGGVAIVTTSNRPPSDLYKDGLNRKLFEPFIALMEERLDVFELKSEEDYRQSRLAGEQVYFHPVTEAAKTAIDTLWSDVTDGQDAPHDLMVKGRLVRLPRFHNGAARVPFADLCEVPLGAADYLAVASAVRVLVLEDIPILSRDNFDAAKRFVTLIDALYEARVRLIASAASAPQDLYTSGTGSFEFERTASRLQEMQGDGWGVEPKS